MPAAFLKIDDDLLLHQPQMNFAEELFTLINDNRAYLREFLPWVDGTKTIMDTQIFLRNIRKFNQGGQQFHTIIIYQNKIVGLIGFNAIRKKHQKGEIGYWIAKNMQKKGIITKAANRLIAYAFKYLNLNRIEIKVSTQNIRSERVAQRLGFTYEGTLRSDYLLNDEFIDLKVFSLLKSDIQD